MENLKMSKSECRSNSDIVIECGAFNGNNSISGNSGKLSIKSSGLMYDNLPHYCPTHLFQATSASLLRTQSKERPAHEAMVEWLTTKYYLMDRKMRQNSSAALSELKSTFWCFRYEK